MAYTTINKHTDHFNTKLYTGTGSSNAITGVGFQPDWVWIKNRTTTATNHRITDAVRGVTKEIYSDLTAAEGTNTQGLTAFGTDGFTVGNNNDYNQNGNNIVSWNWKANGQGSANTDGTINSTVSVNTTAGFSIVKYNGSGTAGTVGHGLGAVPKMIIIKEISGNASGGNQAWSVYHVANGNNYFMNLNTTGAKVDDIDFNDTTPTSSVFSVGVQNRTNSSNGNGVYIAYCFAEKTGYSKFGSYTGNGNNDGAFIYTGFKPAWIMLKNTSNAQNWYIYDNKRTPNNFANYHIYADLNNAEAGGSTLGIDILSNGWKIRTSNDGWNGSGENYIYMAFGQSLVGSNNVPCTAR